LYDVVQALHVMGIIAAFGLWFAWPLLPGGSASDHRALQRILRVVVTPAATIAFLAGVYMASDRGLWSEIWVTIPFLILVILLGLTGAYLTPRQGELAALADTGDIQAYQALHAQVAKVVLAGAVLVLVATFLMVTKVGG
jgi:small-conductance mechanosensitive channel